MFSPPIDTIKVKIMASKDFEQRFIGFKDQTRRFVIAQRQRFIVSSGPVQQEILDTSHMIKILLIGETGSGKSTFINYLTNYFKNGTLHNLKIAIPSTFYREVTEHFGHHEHNVHDTTQSKTDSCNQYMFTDGNTQYLFIDTPGLSDTRGPEQDKINLDKIIDSVEILSGLTAVIIVVNGAVSRLTVNLQNVIAQLRGNLPDIVMDNVVVVLTNTARHTATFSLEVLKLNGNVHPYYMQNSAFSTDPTKWTPTIIQHLQFEYDEAMNEIKHMLTTLNTFKTKSVSAFKNMREIRNEIKALMHNARLEVCRIQKMQDEIAMLEAGLTKANADTVAYKDYTKERIVEKIELVDAAYHSTLCNICNHVCHEKCGLNETLVAGAQIFQQCFAMKNGSCTQCKHKCLYTAHYHAKKTVKISKQTLKDVLADIKSRYDAASNDSTNFQKKITSVADARILLERALQQKKTEIIAKCNELRRICSGFNLASELKALIHQLEIESSMLRNIDAKQQAEDFIRSLKEFCALIDKDQNEQHQKSYANSRMIIISTERPVESQTQMSYRPPSAASSTTSVTDSESYASEEVLNQIRQMAGDSSKNNERQKSKDKLHESDDSSDEYNQSKNDTDEESTTMKRNSKLSKKKSQKEEPVPFHVNTAKSEIEEIKNLRTSELLLRHRRCEDNRTANFILHELKQRSYGKSMAPLTDHADITTYVASTHKYDKFDMESLKHKYEQLKDQICEITEPDILEIEKVPSVLLFEITAVYSLMKSALARSNTGPVHPPFQSEQPGFLYPRQSELYPFYPQPQPPFNQFQQSQYLQPGLQVSSMGGIPYPPTNTYDPTFQVSRLPHLPLDLSYDRELSHVVSRQYDHFLPPDSQYYMHAGSFQDRHERSPIYMKRDRFRHQDTDNYLYHPDLKSSPRPTFPHPSGQQYHSQAQQQHAYQNVNRPIPTLPVPVSSTAPFHPSTTHLSQTFDRMRVSSPFRPIEPNNYQADTNSSRSRSSSGYSEPTSSANSVIGLPFELPIDELRNHTDIQLRSAYDDAIHKNNRSNQYAIYAELQRRCYGDHPLLINEKKTLFEDNYRRFQENSIDELKRLLSEVQHRIHNHLADGNAADLNRIPHELIVEAAALRHLIRIKTAQT